MKINSVSSRMICLKQISEMNVNSLECSQTFCSWSRDRLHIKSLFFSSVFLKKTKSVALFSTKAVSEKLN